MAYNSPQVPPPDNRGQNIGGLKYIYKERTDVPILQDQHPEHYSPEMIARMKECIKGAKEIASFRIKKHVNDPFRSLFTLETKVDGQWVPVKDGDLLIQIMEDIHKLTLSKIEESVEVDDESDSTHK